MAHPKLPAVRRRYDFRCGYRGVSETDAGGELTVDHIVPLSAGGTDKDDNRVYACIRCNQYKGTLRPGTSGPSNRPLLLHPLEDDLSAHLREDSSTGHLIALTARGRFHIDALRLNRRPLLMHRTRRDLVALLEAPLDQAVSENSALRERLELLEAYIKCLELQLEE